MSDKSEIEAIRAVKRYNPCDIKARNGFDLDSELVLAADYDRLLSHVDALEARVEQLEQQLDAAGMPCDCWDSRCSQYALMLQRASSA